MAIPLIYVSRGNIPSLAANSIQVMKMAAAFEKRYPRFSLVISRPVKPQHEEGFSLQRWYGLSKTDYIHALPSCWSQSYPYPPSFIPRGYPAMALAYLYLRRPCCVYTRNTWLLKWAQRWKMPIVLETHQGSPLDEKDYSAIQNNPNFRGLVVISPFLKKLHAERLPNTRIEVLEDGVDLESYAFNDSKEALRRELNIEMRGHAHLAVFTGHFYPDRGIETLFEIAAAFPQVLFLFVGGNDADLQRRQEEVQQRQLSNIELRGFQAHETMPRYQKAADLLFILYSDRLNTAQWFSSLKLFEYMASQTPIIASNLERITDVLSEDCATLIPPDHADSLKNAIQNYLDHPETLQYKAQRAFDAVQAYSWDQRAEHILAMY